MSERRMSAADPDEQVDKEIVRYWNGRVGQATGEDVNFVRRLYTAIARRLRINHQWYATIGDNTLADAILDRLMHNAHRINLSTENPCEKDALPLTHREHQRYKTDRESWVAE